MALNSPVVSNQNPAPGQIDVLPGTTVQLDISDSPGESGVNIKTVVISLNSISVYDGSDATVIDGSTGTYVNGYLPGFTSSLFQYFAPSPPTTGDIHRFTIVPDAALSGGSIQIVSVLAEDVVGNVLSESYQFSTVDTTAPELTVISPLENEFVTDRDAVINFSLTDNFSGVDIKATLIAVEGVTAYDGSDVAVIEGDAGTLVNGFTAGFQGIESAVTGDAMSGYAFAVDGTTSFTDYQIINVSVDTADKSTVPNLLSTAYSFLSTNEDNIHEVRIFGDVVSYSTIEFLQTGTSTKDFEAFSSELRVEDVSPFREYIAVEVQPGVDIGTDTQYDLNLVIGPLSFKLVYDGATKGIEYTT